MLATSLRRQHLASPFPGLRSFSQDESELFFGREGQSDEIARKLGQTRFIAVVGTSGSGKSSLVRAGLLPSLEGGCLVKSGSIWRIVDMRPGSRPIVHLAAALDGAKVSKSPVDPERLRTSSLALIELARSAYGAKHLDGDENLLILVDQFEELFRYKARDLADRDEKAAFVKLLLEVVKQRDFPVYVVITLRSDFLGDCARFRDLPETINAGQYLVPRMTRDQRREAIEGPIHMAGGTIAPRLTQRILNDVGEDPDQLPVMQHALMRTWCHWSAQAHHASAIDIADYETVGALENALSTHADEAYAEACAKVPQRGRQIVKHMFQCLRERDASGRETRRPTALSELCAVAEASTEESQAILECFRQETRSFLMPPMSVVLGADREVDITHESLLRQWKRLLGPASDDEGWLAEEEESRRIILRLADRAEQQSQGSKDYLRGPLLQLALDWWRKRKPNAAWATRYTQSFDAAAEFLRESEENREREVELETEQRRKEEQTRVEQVRREEELKAKQLKVFGAYIFGLLALIISIGGTVGFSIVQRQKGVVQRQEASLQQQKLERAAYEKAKSEERVIEAEKDRLKETKAREIAEDLEAKLIVQMLANQAETGINKGGSLLPVSILLATESMRRQPLVDNQLAVTKGLSLLPKLVGQLPNSAIQLTAFSPDGLLITSEPGFVRIWDPLAQKELRPFHIDGKAGTIAVSSDGQLLGVSYDKDDQGIIQVYKLRTGELDGQRATEPGVSHLFVGSNGNLTAFNGSLYHWNSWNDQQPGLLTEAQAALDSGGAVATSSDQRLLALFDRELSNISVHDSSNGARNSWSVDQASVADIAFDPSNGEHLALFDYSGTIKLWSAPSQKTYLSLQSERLTGVEFSWDGQLLAATGLDGTIRVWSTRDGREVASVPPALREASGLPAKGTATAVALDGVHRIIAVTERGSTRLWQITPIPFPARITAAQISLDGRLAALPTRSNRVSAASRTNTDNILLWSVPDSHVVSTVDPSPINKVLGVIPGLGLAAGTCDLGLLCIVRFGNDGTATLIRKSRGVAQYPASLIFSNDGRFVAGSYTPKGTGRSNAGTGVTNTIVWEIKNQAAEPEIIKDGPHPLNASLLGFSPESDRCILRKPATRGGPGESKLWDLNKKSFSAVPKHLLPGGVVSTAFSADGHLLATLQILSSGPAGAKVISGSSANAVEQNYRISIWRWPDGKEAVRTFGVDTEVRQMSFSPDNHFLITTGSEPYVRVFDLKKGKESGRVALPQLSLPLLAMTFDNDGRRILAFDQYYVTRSLWRYEDLMKEACLRTGRTLTAEEWDKYLPTEKAKYFPTCKAFLPSR